MFHLCLMGKLPTLTDSIEYTNGYFKKPFEIPTLQDISCEASALTMRQQSF